MRFSSQYVPNVIFELINYILKSKQKQIFYKHIQQHIIVVQHEQTNTQLVIKINVDDTTIATAGRKIKTNIEEKIIIMTRITIRVMDNGSITKLINVNKMN